MQTTTALFPSDGRQLVVIFLDGYLFLIFQVFEQKPTSSGTLEHIPIHTKKTEKAHWQVHAKCKDGQISLFHNHPNIIFYFSEHMRDKFHCILSFSMETSKAPRRVYARKVWDYGGRGRYLYSIKESGSNMQE